MKTHAIVFAIASILATALLIGGAFARNLPCLIAALVVFWTGDMLSRYLSRNEPQDDFGPTIC